MTALLALAALASLRGWWLLRRESPGRVTALSLAAFLAGLATAGAALSPRLSALTHGLLIGHMIQHLLLMLFSPLLLLLGSPVLLLSRAVLPRSMGPRGFHVPAGAKRVWAIITHPVAAGGLMAVTAVAWHIPELFDRAMRSHFWHEAENASFFASGVIFWCPVILPWPSRRRWSPWSVPIYLLVSDIPVSVLTAYLAFCGRVLYPGYFSASRPWGMSALDDQVGAAMLMWVTMLVVFMAAAVAAVMGVLNRAPPRTADSPCQLI